MMVRLEDTANQVAAAQIADMALARSLRLATAESLTSGQIAAVLGAARSASRWFDGGVVAYTSKVTHQVLGVAPGAVVTERAAHEMARGVCRLFGTDVAVAVSGAGGPDPLDGQSPGTVCFALTGPAGEWSETTRFTGLPDWVVAATVARALTLLERYLTSLE